MINVSEPFLPEIDRVSFYLEECWKSRVLTNRGQLVKNYESEISKMHSVSDVTCVANCTLGLEFALKILTKPDKKEVITTPFTFKATVCAIVNAGFKPVYCDIMSDGNIDHAKLIDLITPDTAAIMPVHVYGVPCNDKEISSIGNDYKIPVIYDAAHCFGVFKDSKSIFEMGDASVISLHATKGVNCGEGGVVHFKNKENNEKLRHFTNFNLPIKDGIINGTNGKLSELNAALGLAVLESYESIFNRRMEVEKTYRQTLPNHIFFIRDNPNILNNNLYTPLIFSSEDKVLQIMNSLLERGIISRRYFFPCLDKSCQVASDIARRVLCIPTHVNLSQEEIFLVCSVVNDAL